MDNEEVAQKIMDLKVKVDKDVEWLNSMIDNAGLPQALRLKFLDIAIHMQTQDVIIRHLNELQSVIVDNINDAVERYAPSGEEFDPNGSENAR